MFFEKDDFLIAWNNGILGNKLRSWDSLEELYASGYQGLLSIRSRVPDHRKTLYHIPFDQLTRSIDGLILNNSMRLDEMYFGESAPDERLVLQGEFFHGEGQMGSFHNRALTISREKTQMKKAKIWEHHDGLPAEMLLRSVMNENSWADFNDLRELYPDHAIEFSVYDICLGSCAGRNVLIWEVRRY